MGSASGSEVRIRAAVELSGRTLRYAEVEAGPRRPDLDAPPGAAPGPRLLKLGAADFDFDLGAAILEPAGPTHLETISAAMAEMFADSRAESLSMVVHRWQATSFFAPLPAGMPAADRFEQVRQEAAMLAGARDARPVRVTATPVRSEMVDGKAYHWHHVIRLPEAIHARASFMARQIGESVEHRFIDATGAAAAVASRLRPAEEMRDGDASPESVPFALSVGVYGDRFETAITRGDTWYFGHSGIAADGADAAYFGAALLEQLGLRPADVGRLYVYGEDASSAVVTSFEGLLGTTAVPLDPMGLFPYARSQARPEALAAFAPVVGSALRS